MKFVARDRALHVRGASVLLLWRRRPTRLYHFLHAVELDAPNRFVLGDCNVVAEGVEADVKRERVAVLVDAPLAAHGGEGHGTREPTLGLCQAKGGGGRLYVQLHTIWWCRNVPCRRIFAAGARAARARSRSALATSSRPSLTFAAPAMREHRCAVSRVQTGRKSRRIKKRGACAPRCSATRARTGPPQIPRYGGGGSWARRGSRAEGTPVETPCPRVVLTWHPGLQPCFFLHFHFLKLPLGRRSLRGSRRTDSDRRNTHVTASLRDKILSPRDTMYCVLLSLGPSPLAARS